MLSLILMTIPLRTKQDEAGTCCRVLASRFEARKIRKKLTKSTILFRSAVIAIKGTLIWAYKRPALKKVAKPSCAAEYGGCAGVHTS